MIIYPDISCFDLPYMILSCRYVCIRACYWLGRHVQTLRQQGPDGRPPGVPQGGLVAKLIWSILVRDSIVWIFA